MPVLSTGFFLPELLIHLSPNAPTHCRDRYLALLGLINMLY
jgi:hypothetical protein